MEFKEFSDLSQKIDNHFNKSEIIPFNTQSKNIPESDFINDNFITHGLTFKYNNRYQIVINARNKQNYNFIIDNLKLIGFSRDDMDDIHIPIVGDPIPFFSYGNPIAHFNIQDRGSLGCFVKKIKTADNYFSKFYDFLLKNILNYQDKDIFILSNNHVLANCNRGIKGKDLIRAYSNDEYSGYFDFAILDDYIALNSIPNTNSVDAAIAKVIDPTLINIEEIQGIKKLKKCLDLNDLTYSFKQELITTNNCFTKIGHGTGQTWGKIVSFHSTVRNIDYGIQGLTNCSFYDIIEMHGIEENFSGPGDSGSIVIREDGSPIGMILGGTLGSSFNNSKGITYVIPLSRILKELNIELII